MKRAFIIALCLLMLAGVVGCGSQSAPQTNPTTTTVDPTPYPTQTATGFTTTTTGSGTTTQTTTKAPQYVLDPVINQYILDFEKQTRFVLAGLHQNRDKSVTAYIDLFEITIRTTPSGLHFSLTGGDTKADRDLMLDIFVSLAQVADPNCSNNRIESAVIFLKGQKKAIANHEVSDALLVSTYVPITDEDTVRVPCRMEFIATKRLPATE